MLTRRGVSAGLATLLAAIPAVATAQIPVPKREQKEPYPTRPLRLVVPYAAGGGTDAIARLIADALGEQIGQSVVVENVGAGAGNVATAQAAAAAPDGYTLLMANQGPMVVNPHLFKSLRVDPLAVFDPVTQIAYAPLLLAVPKSSRFETFKDFLDFGAANPGKLTYGSAGNGSASHMATVLLARLAGLQAVHVPYRGAGPALTDLLGERMDFMITTMPSVMELVEADKLRVLAVTSKTRARKFPETPTIAESGFPDYEASAWYGFVVPKGTPRYIVDFLRASTVRALLGQKVRERLLGEGAVTIGSSPGEFARMMRAESRRWAWVLKEASIAVE
jgi:tripartite-type tricarboxylate transporter receptor subunit TctC